MNTSDQTPNHSNFAAVSQWANRLPWWPYAVTTLLMTMIVASLVGRDAGDRRLPGGGSLPVKSLAAGEFQPAAPLTLRGPTLPDPSIAERAPAPAIANSGEFMPDNRPAKHYDAVRSRRLPVPATTPEQFHCREIRARAQLGQVLSVNDRESLRKECPS